MRRWSGILGMGATLLAPICLGFFWGRQDYPGRPPNFFTVVGIVGLILLLFGWSKAAWRPGPHAAPWLGIACGAMVLYVAGVLLSDPFVVRAESQWEIGRRAPVLLPLFAGLVLFARKGLWLSLLGTAVFTTAAVALFVINISTADAGTGFLRYWLGW